MLTLLRLVSSYIVATDLICFGFVAFVIEEGDGRCVRALWPGSAKLSIFSLLLNPP